MSKDCHEFVFNTEPDDSLKCQICLEVASEPMQHECGRLFCKECIEKNGNNPCPNCRQECPQYFLDIRGINILYMIFTEFSL